MQGAKYIFDNFQFSIAPKHFLMYALLYPLTLGRLDKPLHFLEWIRCTNTLSQIWTKNNF